MAQLRIGVIGCGNISGIYFKNLQSYDATEVVAVADLDSDRAKQAAEQNGIRTAQTPEELLANPDVELVLNLTIPKAHASVAQAAVEAGKHVYNEKPLTMSRDEARLLLKTAKEKGLRVGCAPDTFLGSGLQTCRKVIDKGVIGEPVAAQAFMLCHGHESWHPAPEFYYETGGGPMLDMGPYYITALLSLMGPVRRVTGSTRISFPTRTITSQPKNGKIVKVETPTHLAGVLDFAGGAVGEITTSFDVWTQPLPPIIIYGSEGTMIVPDPNGFGGEVNVRGRNDDDWHVVPQEHGFCENSRGLGVLDIALALREGRPHRASGELALHALDIMLSFQDASESGKHQVLATTVERPAAMPTAFDR